MAWDDVMSERDKQVYAKAGFGKRQGFGANPAILVIDVNYNFVGDKPEPILQSIERWRTSCGEEGWQSVGHIRTLLEAARPQQIPILYTTGSHRGDGKEMGGWSGKNARMNETLNDQDAKMGNDIVADIAPREGDFVIVKKKPSAFFGTPLASYLIDMKIDTLIVTGCTTSGCVRASVIDGFSYNFKMAVVEECVFDRGELSHRVNLFDMHSKYADVVPLQETVEFIRSLERKV